MFENMGLGIKLHLDDEVSNNVDPVIRDINRLENSARGATRAYNELNDTYNRRKYNRGMSQDMMLSFKGLDYVLGNVTARLNRATASAEVFANATNRLQSYMGFQRMYQDIFRVNRQIGLMGYGMSGLQKQMMDNRAFNMINYQMKDLQEKIALTKKGLEEMQRSPDSSKFVNEIAMAQRALAQYEAQIKRINMQQTFARANGQNLTKIGGSDFLMNMPSSYMTNIRNRLVGMSMLDMGVMSQSAYNSINKTAKMMVDLGYTTMETRQKLTQLTGAMMMVGLGMSQFVSLPLAIATGAMGVFASRFEKAQNMMQARGLIPNSMMEGAKNFDSLMGDVWVRSGFAYDKVATTMSDINLQIAGLKPEKIAQLAEYGLRFEKAWGIGATDSILSADRVMKRFGLTGDQSLDILTLALKETNGDLEKANEYINNNIGSLKRMTAEGQKGAEAFEMFSASLERGGIYKFMTGLRELADLFRILWESGIDTFVGKLGDALFKLGAGLKYVLENNPALAKFTAWTVAIGGTFLMLLGPILLLTGVFLRYRSVIQAVSATTGAFTKGGFAVVSPMAVMARERMQAFTVAVARLPQTFLAVIPLLYTLIRGFPALALNLIRLNPLFAVINGLLVSYATNFGGFRDMMDAGIDTLVGKWGELEKMYKESSLPSIFRGLKENAIAFAEGVVEGFTGIFAIGKEILNAVLLPIKAVFDYLEPVVIRTFNWLDKLFGGAGDASSTEDMVDRIFGTEEKWRKIGIVVGRVLAGLTAFYFLSKAFGTILSPFQRLSGVLTGIGNKLSGMRKDMQGVKTIPALFTPMIARAREFITNPPPATPNPMGGNVFTRLGLGGQVAMGRQFVSMNGAGMSLANNPALLASLRNSGHGRLANITPTGGYAGGTVMQSNRGTLMRALLGQRLFNYTPNMNAQGAVTGYTRTNLATTGGLLRTPMGGFMNVFGRGNGVANSPSMSQGAVARTQARASSLASTIAQTRAVTAMTGAMSNFRNRVVSAGQGISNLATRGYFGATTNPVARGIHGIGSRLGNQLTMAGVRNPYAGMTAGGSPLRQMGNFARVGVTGTASMLASGAMMTGSGIARGAGGVVRGTQAVGRGVGSVARGAGRVAMSPLSGLARGAGALMALAMSPLALAGGLVGYGAYKAFGGEKKDKDGNVVQKGSVHNIAGNMDKATANMLKGGDKQIKGFWDKFWKTATPILKSTGQLLVASFTALVKALPSIMRSIWGALKMLGNFIREGAKTGWNWMKTDGLTMLKSFSSSMRTLLGKAWTWIKGDGKDMFMQFVSDSAERLGKLAVIARKLLGKAWEWIKGDGLRLFGSLFAWLVGTAIPNTIVFLVELFAKGFKWVMDDGIKLLGKLIRWIIETGIPEAVSFIKTALGGAWTWVKDEGLGILGDMIVSIGGIAADMGSALWNGITTALSGIGSYILGLLPSWSDITGYLSRLGGGQSNSEKAGRGKPTKRYARGGFINTPHLGLVGEAGAEVIIPLGSNMRNRAQSLFMQTAGILGYQVSNGQKDEENSSPFIQGISNSNFKQPPPPPTSVGKVFAPAVRQQNTESTKTPQTVDNSFTIDKVEIVLPDSMKGVGQDSATKQAEYILKELQKIIKQKRQSGGKNLTLEDIIAMM